MLTAVVSLGVYCPQTGETQTEQIWLHSGPFDTPQDVLARLLAAAAEGDGDWYFVVESRQARNPPSARARWSQLQLDV